ncbi:MAG TPA: radical SAM family heme chaperone HemW [Bacteroidota bacterium]|nr:radical SAM family heme chaperone HemW [Bacteroidota bacterium]
MAGLYLHIPFCEHKCLYCDFYSIAPDGSRTDYEKLIGRFLSALNSEAILRAGDPRFRGQYDTVFFGGGTPSLLSPSNIDEILRSLRGHYRISDNAEVTLETNPGTVDPDKLRAFRKAGINRLSVGIQSFHEDDLRFLTRIHSADQARECVKSAAEAGFDNISIDLIFALPGQTRERWESNLEQALELRPRHLSCYSLIVEPTTPLARLVQTKQVTPLSPEADNELYQFTIDFLKRHGFEQYEVSNFALPGYRSRHNANYWNHTNYLGLGPSAHSFWSGKRWWNIANVNGYIDRLERSKFPVAGEELLSADQLRDEEIFLALRSDGLDVAGFSRRHDLDLAKEHRPLMDELVSARLAAFDGRMLRLTAKGYAVCDEICSAFLQR